MTNLPNDPIDPREARLIGRVRSYTDPAVVPIDALAIAHDVAAHRRRGLLARVLAPASGVARLGWIAAGALLVVAAVAGIGLAGSSGLLTGTVSPTPTLPSQATVPTVTSAPSVAPTPTSVAQATLPAATPTQPAPTEGACTTGQLSARITSWSGAAGSRVATVELTNTGRLCRLPTQMQPELVDAHGAVLIQGARVASSPTLSLASNGRVSTMVDASNYCGPTPAAPVTVAFVLLDRTRFVAAPDTNPKDIDGVPPCMGSGQPAAIQMQAWHA
jgi:hypothetical protein